MKGSTRTTAASTPSTSAAAFGLQAEEGVVTEERGTRQGKDGQDREMEVESDGNGVVDANPMGRDFADELDTEVCFLRGQQQTSLCGLDLVGILKPYMLECIRRRATKEPFINIKKH